MSARYLSGSAPYGDHLRLSVEFEPATQSVALYIDGAYIGRGRWDQEADNGRGMIGDADSDISEDAYNAYDAIVRDLAAGLREEVSP